MKVAGVLLAGGQSRRMGGGDKALRLLGGITLLERVIERLRPQVDTLVLNANGDPARFAKFGLPVAPDNVPGFAGPLAGVLAGLDWTAANLPDHAFVVSVATDAPFLPADLVTRLVEGLERERGDLACAASGGRTHPVVALWPISLREDLRRALIDGEQRAVGQFQRNHKLAVVEWPATPRDPFFNVNTPGDLSRAEDMLRQKA